VGSTGAPVTNRGFTFSTRNYSRPARVGIAPIEDILGREVVSSNRRAVDRSWQVRSNAAFQQERSGAAERWKPRRRTVHATGDVRICGGRAGSPS
jgi:hypothetical protein